MSITRAEAAVAYATGASPLGIAVPVVPMHPETKVPLIPRWGDGGAPTSADDVLAAWERHPDASIGAVLRDTRLVVIDIEGAGHGYVLDEVIDEIHAAFGALPTTLSASTKGGGRHLYFTLPEGRDPDALAGHLVTPGGTKITGVDIKKGSRSGNGGLIIVPADIDGGTVDGRCWEDIVPIAPLPDPLDHGAMRSASPLEVVRGSVPEGDRHNWLLSQAGSMRRRGFPVDAIRAALVISNDQMCIPPMARAEVLRIADDVAARYAPGVLPQSASWPEPLRQEAFRGIAGKFVEALLPYSEADPVALLLSFLSAFGSVVGPHPYDAIGSDRHGARIWPVFVGETAAGRKGTSLAPVVELFDQVDPTWSPRRKGGIGSGEVVIFEVRDPVREDSGDGKIVTKDPGVEDKRLFIAESEFVGLLTVNGRDGSILSPVLRAAWDGGTLQQTVKHSPARATDAHITVLGHITPDELRKGLKAVEKANGFANRFIFAMVRRSKLLPRAGALPPGLLEDFVEPLARLVDKARTCRLVKPTETFWQVYEPQYERLSSPPPGLAGSTLARGAPYVRRLALVYALLDGESLMYADHAKAALAVWDYCEASTRSLFEGRMGIADDDKLLEALRRAPGGMTRTAIRDLFGKHRDAVEIGAMRDRLVDAERIIVESEATGGASAERWRLRQGVEGASVASVALSNASQGEVPS